MNKTIKKVALPFLAVINGIWVWFTFFGPILQIPYFFYLDSPTIMIESRAAEGFWVDASSSAASGRYLPFFVAVNRIVSFFGGANLHALYMLQALELLAIIGVLLYFFSRRGVPMYIRLLVPFVLIALSTPEATYSIGKSEPLLVLLLVLAIVFDDVARHTAGRWRFLSALAAVCMFTSLGVWTKETGAAFIVYPLAILAFEFFGKSSVAPNSRSVMLVGAPILGVVLARTPLILASTGDNPSRYTNFSPTLESIAANAAGYWQRAPDLAIGLALLAIGNLWLWIAKRPLVCANRDAKISVGFSGLAVAYTVGMHLWRWPFTYYLFPAYVFLGVAILFLAVAAGSAGATMRRVLLPIALLYFVSSKIYTLPAFHYAANAQFISNKAYTSAIQTIGRLTSGGPPDPRIYLLNFLSISEQPVQTRLSFELLGYPKGIQPIGAFEYYYPDAENPNSRLYNSSFPRALDMTPRDGDLMLAFQPSFPGKFHVRGVSPETGMYSTPKIFDGLDLVEVARDKYTVQSWMPTPISDGLKQLDISNGYQIWSVSLRSTAGMWIGRTSDGFIGLESSYKVIRTSSKTLRLELSSPVVANVALHVFKEGAQVASVVVAVGFPQTFLFENVAISEGDTIHFRIVPASNATSSSNDRLLNIKVID